MKLASSSYSLAPPGGRRWARLGIVAMAMAMLSSLASIGPVSAFGSSSPPPAPPSVNAGGYMTCGIRADGVAACWGANQGQNTNSTEGPGQATPPADVTFVEVNSGYSHACGVKPDQTLACWGSNHNGASTCALRTDGTAACWGTDDAGQVSGVPADVTFTQLTVGIRHACGLREDGSGLCWGSNLYGQLNVPAEPFSQINSGNFDVCGLRQVDGTAVCWGRNAGQQAVTAPGEFVQVTAGFQHACGRRADGTLACWGNNREGQATPPVGTFNDVSAGTFHSCGMRTDGTAVCWGNNAQGRVTPTMTSMAPTAATVVGTPYTHQFTATYMSPAPTWTIVSGSLPPGLALSPSGEISGVPTTPGAYVATVAGTNGLAPAATETFTITVLGVPEVEPPGPGVVTCAVNSLGKCVVGRVGEAVDDLPATVS
jgi:hypothetical protein